MCRSQKESKLGKVLKAPKELNSEVEVNQDDFFIINSESIARIKNKAQHNASGKYRTCIHRSEVDFVHEMLIVHKSNTFVRPHKHALNGESLHFIEGSATAIIFDQRGKIEKFFEVGDASTGRIFFYHMQRNVFHTLLIESEFLVFKETTQGPFIRENTIFPDWAPNSKDPSVAETYMAKLKKLVSSKLHE